MKPTLMFGFNLISYNNFTFKIATVEKALVDFLYLNPSINNTDSFYELRINQNVFNEIINQNTLLEITERFQTKSLTVRVLNFLQFINDDKSR